MNAQKPDRPIDPMRIPLPDRPGTTWEMDLPHDRCKSCKRSYSSHGAPSDVAKALGIEENRRHLICRWSDEAWSDYNRQRKRATVDLFIYWAINDLDRFNVVDRNEIIRRLLVHYKLVEISEV
jgi:hypothetical protein